MIHVNSKKVATMDIKSNLDKIYADIQLERHRQEYLKYEGKFKWTCSDNSYVLDSKSYSISLEKKLSVLGEEFGEVSNEIVEFGISKDKYKDTHMDFPEHREVYYMQRIRTELVQVAAVTVAWIESIDKNYKEIRDIKESTPQLEYCPGPSSFEEIPVCLEKIRGQSK
jgi:hypothetical protein